MREVILIGRGNGVLQGGNLMNVIHFLLRDPSENNVPHCHDRGVFCVTLKPSLFVL